MQRFIDLICDHKEVSPIKEFLSKEISTMKLLTIFTLVLVASKSATCCSTSGMTFFAKKYTVLTNFKTTPTFIKVNHYQIEIFSCMFFFS